MSGRGLESLRCGSIPDFQPPTSLASQLAETEARYLRPCRCRCGEIRDAVPSQDQSYRQGRLQAFRLA